MERMQVVGQFEERVVKLQVGEEALREAGVAVVGARERTGHGSDGVRIVARGRMPGDPQIPQSAFRNPQSHFLTLARPYPLVRPSHGVPNRPTDQSAAEAVAEVHPGI